MATRVECSFRVWVHPKNGDPPEIEVWFQGLENTDTSSRFVSDWVLESLQCEDFHDLFGLSTNKHWQVVGRCEVRGSYDFFGEYDEELTILDFEKAEVPETWFDTLAYKLEGK